MPLFAVATALAFLLDAGLGDPRSWPHPVRALAWLAARLEAATRSRWPERPRLAGILASLGVYGAAGGAALAAWLAAWRLHPWAGVAVAAWIVYTTVAARDLIVHALAVARPLAGEDLPAARRAVGMIVGRDTETLDASGVARAAVESVAESTVDGVTAPLFWGFLLGPAGAMVYRAANTLDSLFGHKDERYHAFGRFPAKVDDALNWLPARLTAGLMCLTAGLLFGPARGRAAWRTLRRDGRNHASPNAGLVEAAMAGALGVRLGGPRRYDGELHDAPFMGEAATPDADLDAGHVRRACLLMYATSALFTAAGVLALWGIIRLARI